MTEVRLPSDQAIRDRIVTDLETSFAVEAGAGTGKTALLTSRIVEAVRTGRARLSDIVAITFTEKAASEFKDRIRTLLEKQRAESAGAEAQRLSDALAEVDTAHASTIHSFAAELLRERPVEANVDPGFEVADAVTSGLLFDEVWQRWLARQLDRTDSPLRAAFIAGLTTDHLKDFALFLRSHPDLEPLGETADLDASLRKFVAAFVEGARALESETRDQCPSPECSCAVRIEQAVRAADDLESLPPSDQIARLPGIGSFDISRPQKACRERKAACIQGLKRLQDLLGDIQPLAGHRLAVRLASALREMVGRYEVAKRERSILDFDDLLLKARDLLRDHLQVRAYFQQRFKMLLVDECQDTDPLQTEICFFLAEDGAGAATWSEVQVQPGKLLFVGDPKQSIYRFRRADIEAYEEAKEVVAASGECVTIEQNFRSRPGCVGWFNAVFSELIRRPSDGRSYQPDYAPLTAWRTEQGPPCVSVLQPPEGADFKHVDDARAAEAAAVAKHLRAVVERGDTVFDKALGIERPVGYGDVALLFRTRTAFPVYAEALEAEGVPFRAVSGRDFFARQEVAELRRVLAAVDRPHDGLAVVGALRTSLLGVSDVELANAASGGFNYRIRQASPGGPHLQAAFDLLRSWHEQRHSISLSALVQTVLSDTKALELFYLKPDGEQRAANLTKVIDAARSYEDKPGATFGGFVRWLQDLSTAGEEDESALADEVGDFVRLFTIHKAKGLEFPVVVLGDISNGQAHAIQHVIDRLNSRFDIQIGSKEKGVQTLDFENASALEKQREEAEARRLFYVAVTRARDRLILTCFPKGGKCSGYMKYLDDLAGDTASDHTETVVAEPGTARPAGQAFRVDLSVKPPPACAALIAERQAWLAERADKMAAAANSRPLRTASGLAEHDVGPTARSIRENALALGTAVHTVLERIDLASGEGLGDLAAVVASEVGLPKLATEIEARVRSALASELVRRAASATSLWREVPFTLDIDGTVLEGTIDLAFVDAEGMHLVDYKTDAVEPEALAEHAAHYRLQVGAYALAVSEVLGALPATATLLFLGADAARPVAVAVDDTLLNDTRTKL